MKKNNILLLVIIFASFATMWKCSDSNSNFSSNQKLKYIPFSNKERTRWGLVDFQGNILFDKEKFQPSLPFDGIYRTKDEDNLYEYYTATEQPTRIGEKYINASLFSEGFAVCAPPDESLIIIDTKGKKVAKVKRDNNGKLIKKIGLFSNGLAVFINSENMYGFINTNGEVVINADYDYAEAFNDGLALVGIKTNNNMEYGFIDTQGNEKIKISDKFTTIKSFSNGLAVYSDVKAKDEWGCINKEGEVIIKPYDKFKKILNFNSEGLAPFKSKYDDWGIVDKEGNIVIRAKYDENLKYLYNNTFIYRDNNKYGFINTEEKQIVKTEFDNVLPFYADNTYVLDRRDYILIDKKGKQVSKNEFYYIPFDDIMSQYEAYKTKNMLTQTDFFDLNGFLDFIDNKITANSIYGLNSETPIDSIISRFEKGSLYKLDSLYTTPLHSYIGEFVLLESIIDNYLLETKITFNKEFWLPIKQTKSSGSGFYARIRTVVIGYKINHKCNIDNINLNLIITKKTNNARINKIIKGINKILDKNEYTLIEHNNYYYKCINKQKNVKLNLRIKFKIL